MAYPNFLGELLEMMFFGYNFNGQVIERCDEIVDLGVVLDSGMSFLAHYNYVISKCMRMAGFIKRFGREFDDPYVLKHLYVSLVRPIMEFKCCVCRIL
jgi:hypothetical protein